MMSESEAQNAQRTVTAQVNVAAVYPKIRPIGCPFYTLRFDEEIEGMVIELHSLKKLEYNKERKEYTYVNQLDEKLTKDEIFTTFDDAVSRMIKNL
jgi:hypothetical protein